MTAALLAFLPHPEEREGVRSAFGSDVSIHWCFDRADAAAIARRIPVAGIIWDLQPDSSRALVDIHRLACVQASTAPRILLRADLQSSIIRELIWLAGHVTDASVSIRGSDDWLLDVTSIEGDECSASAGFCILRSLVGSRHASPALETVAGVLLVAKHRMHVRQLATLLGLPRRTLEFRLKMAHLPVPERLLGWSIALHTMWRLDVLRWPLKRAALLSGFGASATLATYIARHVGARPAQLSRQGGFTVLLDHFLELLSRSDLVVKKRPHLVGRLESAHDLTEHGTTGRSPLVRRLP